VDTDVDRLIDRMHELLQDADLARELGQGARRTALRRFSIDRFAADWDAALREVAQGTTERTNSSTLAT
jgi:glycosyltransferase involved in cell wall biosynthesis